MSDSRACLSLPLARPPIVNSARVRAEHGDSIGPESYRLRRLWVLNLHEGEGELMWRGQACPFKPGFVSLAAPDVDHSYQFRGVALVTWIHFTPEPAAGTVVVPVVKDLGEDFHGWKLEMEEAAQCREAQPARAQAILWRLLWRLAQTEEGGKKPEFSVRLRAVMNEIEMALETPLRISFLAKVAGCSMSHLNRLFIAETGMSSMAWVRNRRIQTSLTLLRETRLSVQRIAGLTGFFDAAHLRRTVFAGTGRRIADLRVDAGFDAEISDRDGAAFLHVDPDQ